MRSQMQIHKSSASRLRLVYSIPLLSRCGYALVISMKNTKALHSYAKIDRSYFLKCIVKGNEKTIEVTEESKPLSENKVDYAPQRLDGTARLLPKGIWITLWSSYM